MLLKKKLIALCAISALTAPALTLAATTGNATPTRYLVTVSNIQFHRATDPSNTFITYASGTNTFDIAGTSPGGFVGKLAKSADLPPGTYDQIRFNVSKDMQINAQSNGVLSVNSKPCRTTAEDTTVTNPFGDVSVSEASLGATDGGTPATSEISVPTGSAVVLPTGFVDAGTTLQGTVSVNFTIPETVPGQPVEQPNITINFDVTNAVQMTAISATQCVIFPGPPSININVG